MPSRAKKRTKHKLKKLTVTYERPKFWLIFKSWRNEKGQFIGRVRLSNYPTDLEKAINEKQKYKQYAQYDRFRKQAKKASEPIKFKSAHKHLISSEQINKYVTENRYKKPIIELKGKLHLTIEFYNLKTNSVFEASALSSRHKITPKTYRQAFNEAYKKCLAQCPFSPDYARITKKEYVYLFWSQNMQPVKQYQTHKTIKNNRV